jgi:hypothetical protein
MREDNWRRCVYVYNEDGRYVMAERMYWAQILLKPERAAGWKRSLAGRDTASQQ